MTTENVELQTRMNPNRHMRRQMRGALSRARRQAARAAMRKVPGGSNTFAWFNYAPAMTA